MSYHLIVFSIGTALAAFGFLSIFDPEKAFRVANAFQVREVELSRYGEDSAVLGGVLSIIVGWLMVSGLLSIEHAVAAVVLAFVPFGYVYRDRLRPSSRETER